MSYLLRGAQPGAPVSVKTYGAKGDGVTDDTAAINAAIAALTSGGVLYFDPGTYYCATDVTCSVNKITLRGAGKSSQIYLADGKKISAAANDFWMDALYVNYPAYTTHTSTSRGVEVQGTSAASYATNVKITNCFFGNCPMYGIYAQFISGLDIRGNTVDTVGSTGIAVLSCDHFTVANNHVANINMDSYNSNAWGVLLSQLSISSKTGDLANGSASVTNMNNTTSLTVGMVIVHSGVPVGTTITAISGSTLTLSAKATATSATATLNFQQPPSTHGAVTGNFVENNPLWEGLDSHSGQDIIFSGNTVVNCLMGIVVGDSGTTFGMAPQRVSIVGNTITGWNSEDSTKLVTAVGTAATMNAAPNFTVRVNDYLVSAGQSRRISAVASQTSYTLASAFSVDPTAGACTVTQKGRNKVGVALTGDNGGAPGTVDQYAAGCSITGNTVAYYGNEEDALSGAVYIHSTRGLALSGNTLIEPNQYGLLAYYDNQGLAVSGNTCIDSWSNTKTDPSFVRIDSDYQSITFNGNIIKTGGKSATYTNTRGFNFGSGLTNTQVAFGTNFYDGTAGGFITNLPATGALRSFSGAANHCALYVANGNSSISNGATPTIVQFDSSVSDTESLVTTGSSWKYTAPVTGKYRIEASVPFGASEAWTQGGHMRLYLYKNGSVFRLVDRFTPQASITARMATLQCAIVMDLTAADYIDLRARHAESAARTVTYNAVDNNECFISITYLGTN